MQPVILAAGKGSRMRSSLPKTLYPVNGRAMIDSILEVVRSVQGLKNPVIVVGYGAEEVKSHIGHEYTFAYQAELNGTGGAVKAALKHIPEEGHVLVLYGDQPFVRPETLKILMGFIEEKCPTIVQSVVSLQDFEGWREPFKAFGRIVRNNKGAVERIVEYKNASDA